LRRPIVYILFAVATGILLQVEIDPPIIACMILGLVCLMLMSGFTLPKHVIPGIFFILIMLSSSLNVYFSDHRPDPFIGLDGETLTVEGRVRETGSDGTGSLKVVVETKKIVTSSMDAAGHTHRKTRQGSDERMLVSFKGGRFSQADAAAMAGRYISLAGKAVIPSGEQNPKLFDYRTYLRTRNIRTAVNSSIDSLILLPVEPEGMLHALSAMKGRYLERLKKRMGDTSYGIMAGIMFGDTSDIDEDVYRDFQVSGTSHILSVSGLHTAIVYLWVKKLCMDHDGIAANCLAAAVLMIYAALSVFSPTVVRAVFMIFICIAGKLLGERYDLTSCCAFSATALLLYNPYLLYSLGFQLSYLAVFSMAVILPRLKLLFESSPFDTDMKGEKQKGKIGSLRRKAVDSLLVLISVQIGMAPAIAYFFNYFSLSAFWVNFPVAALASLILPLGIIMLLVSLLPPVWIFTAVFDMLAYAADLLITAMAGINGIAADLPLSSFVLTSPNRLCLVMIYCLIFFICSEYGQHTIGLCGNRFNGGNDTPEKLAGSMGEKNASRIISTIVAVVIALSLIIPEDVYQEADVVFLDVGQGDCIHIRTPSGKNILIDSGGSSQWGDAGESRRYDIAERVLLPYLLKNDAGHIDLALVTHLHDDHFQGLCSLSKKMSIDQVLMGSAYRSQEDEIMEKLNVGAGSIIYIEHGDKINIESGVSIEAIYPADSSETLNIEEENDMNLVFLLDYFGCRILITGDLTGIDEAGILEKNPGIKADILKVAHHGSRFSSTDAFIDAVDPDFAVIQVGKNNFGHPSAQVIEKLKKKGIIIMRTDQDHGVLFDIDKSGRLRSMTMQSRRWISLREFK